MLDFPASHVWLPEGKQFNKHQQPEKYWGTPCLGLCSIFNGFCLALIRVGKWSIIPAQKMCSQWKIVSGFAECCIVVLAWKRKGKASWATSNPMVPFCAKTSKTLEPHRWQSKTYVSIFSRTQSVYIYVDIDNECMLIYNVMSVMLYPI